MMSEETLDEILDGKLRVLQKKKGYRFSLDSILLAHFVSLKTHSRVVELGCGAGIILLILAKRFNHVRYDGLEIQDKLAALARKNVDLNGVAQQVKITEGDVRNIKDVFPANIFDAAVFNPPYRKLRSGRINPEPEKAIARHEVKGSLNDFMRAAQYLLKNGGQVFVVYPAKRLPELITVLRKNSIEPKRMKPVYSDNSSAAEFILVEGRKDSGEELKIEQPLVIYDQNRKYSRDMMEIFTELARFPNAAVG